jgi:hypothetical protein
MNGEPGAGWMVVRDLIVRTAIITLGLAVVDRHDPKLLLKGFAGAASIEAFVFAWMAFEKVRGASPMAQVTAPGAGARVR